MKRILIIIIFLTGIMSISSCRSTSEPCGLAEKIQLNTHTPTQELHIRA